MDLLRTDFDIHHIAVASRKIDEEHALVRLIISTLATSEEVENLVKGDIRKVKKGDTVLYTVRLRSGRKSRIAPLDERTYNILMKIAKSKRRREKIFRYSKKQMDEIIKKYSPPGKEYDLKGLRDAVMKILKDCLFFEEDYLKHLLEGTNFDKVVDFVYDFHPIYSGMWDLDDDEVAKDFISDFKKYIGVEDARKIAEIICESENRVKKLIS